MLLMDKGYGVLHLAPPKATGVRINFHPRTWRMVRGRDITWFFRQLSTLIGAGIPLVKSIDILQQEADSYPLKVALDGVAQDLERGDSLSGALSNQEQVFPPIAFHMVKSGEAGGVLEEVLQRLTVYLEKEQELVKQIKSAALYPLLLALFAGGVVFFLLGYVVPQMIQTFDYDISMLPGLSSFVLSLSGGVRKWFWPAILFIIGMGLVLKWYRGTANGRLITDRLFMTLPVLGSIVSKLAVTRFANSLGILVQSGVNIIQALEVSEITAGNAVLARAIRRARQSVQKGLSLADAFRLNGVFDPLVIQMVLIGEETGRLDETLLKVAEYYETEAEHLIKSGIALLEPVLIIIMALVVGLIVGGTIVPLLEMMTAF